MGAALCDPLAWAHAPVVYDQAAVEARIPQRHEMELLHGVLHFDREAQVGIGVHHAKSTDFWVRGHVPGRPLMPGVVMVEVAAQLCAFVFSFDMPQEPDRFFGFAGIENARFRGQVRPGDTMLVAAKVVRHRRNMAGFFAQSWVDGALVFEGTITGIII